MSNQRKKVVAILAFVLLVAEIIGLVISVIMQLKDGNP